MKVTIAITATAIIIHAFCKMGVRKERGFFALAACTVVGHSSPQQQTNESETASNKMEVNGIKANGSTVSNAFTTPCQNNDYDNLFQHEQFPIQYQITATLDTGNGKLFENFADNQNQWKMVIMEAMEAERAQHYKQPQRHISVFEQPILEDEAADIDVQILGTHCSSRICIQTFVVLYKGFPIPAEIIVSDMLLLSLSWISARLKIPVESITASLSVNKGNSQWWIVAVVVGIAIGIIATGWLCLFIYYNTCGRPYATTSKKLSTNTIFLKDELIQTTENDTAGEKDFDVRTQETENERSSPREVSKNTPICALRDVEDFSQTGAITSANLMNNNEQMAINDITEQFNYPLSIITRPKRKDLFGQRLKQISDASLPVLKEIKREEQVHPRPIPPTVSGILEVRSLAESVYGNPMNCL